jgi:ABC-type transport system involved in multi-copper enzyme maturation permease subunit
MQEVKMLSFRKIRIITWKDILEVKQNKSVVLSLALVPLLIMVVMPMVMLLVSSSSGSADAFKDPDLQMMFERMPAAISDELEGMNDVQLTMAMILGYLFAPMFLILPLVFSASIAAESFAGERERKTLEALLYTSASDAELFIGKALAAFIPSVLVAWISFALYIIVLNGAGYPLFGRIWFPFTSWYPLVFWVTPALAALGVGATVLISAKVQTFMGAYQTSGSLVLLVLGLVAGQASGVLYLSAGVGMIIGLIFWLAAGVLIFLAIQQFNRKTLLLQKAN